jgi:hypothetical protein
LNTIGKGPQIATGNYTNYTEEDVKAAAKIFSGYEYDLNNSNKDPDTNIRRCRVSEWRHSNVAKVFSPGLSGGTAVTINQPATPAGMATELDQFINLVFDRIETAKNICRKLYRYFLHRDINADVETNIIGPMATALKNDNYNLNTALSMLLQSQHFYDLDDANNADNKIGGMVKSPLDLVMQTVRFFNISPFTFPGNNPYTIWDDFYRYGLIEGILNNANMYLFSTTTVAGFPPYYLAPKYDRLWFDTSTITQRYFLGRVLLENKRLPYAGWANMGAQIDIVTWVRNNITTPADGNKIVDELVNYLLPEPPNTARRNYFLNQTLLGSLSLLNWQNEWSTYLNNGNTSVVKPRLELLFKAILYSQEYQLQ